MDSVFGWEAMEADPLFTTKPIVESKIGFPVVGDDGAPTVVAPDYVADCVFDSAHPTEPLCIVGTKGTSNAAMFRVKKGKPLLTFLSME